MSDNHLTPPTFQDILDAHEVVKQYAHQTPVMSSQKVNERAGAELFFKCENFQKVGAFKFRGGCNTVMPLDVEKANKGVATHSSGNHAQAIALAAKMKGIPAYIVMPENSPKVKVAAVQGYAADITFCEPTLQAREDTLNTVVERTGAMFIHPYNDSRIVAGQGTAAVEFLNKEPELDVMMAPVGGGGLISGTAISSKAIKPNIQVIGAEPEVADDAYRSFKAGELIPNTNVNTIADGLRTSLGSLTFSIIQEHVDDILTVTEEEIIDAMRFIWERMKMIIEPSCAVPVAAVFKYPDRFKGRKVGVIITGGNVDLENLPW